MGRRSIPCPMVLPDYTSKVHRGDAFLYDLWGRGCYSSRNQIPHVKVKFLHSKQKRWVVKEELGLNWRVERKHNGLIGLLPKQAQAEIWCQHKVKTTGNWRLGLKKSPRNGKEPSMGKVGTQLGRTILYHIGSWDRCLLSGGSRVKSCTTPLECKQP